MSFPCSVNTNSDLIFVIGREFKTLSSKPIDEFFTSYDIDLYKNPSIGSFLYNPLTYQWRNVSQHFPCPMHKPNILDKYSCTFLQAQNMVLTAIENCTAAFNMTSWSWTSFDLPLENGVLFASDIDDQSVYYMASKEDNTSNIYTVSDNT